jgi:hypothetical protein
MEDKKMTENGYSLADISAVTGNRNDDWGGGGMGVWWVIIILLFFMGGGFGGGWGNGNNAIQNAATQADIMRGFDNQTVIGKLDRLGDGISSLGYDQLNQMNNLQRDLCTGFSSIAAAIEQARFDAKSCCCETNRNIDAVRYENAQNTCAITNAIHSEGEQTRGLFTATEMQSLRDQLADAKSTNNLCSQSAYLLNQLRPYPVQAIPFGGFGAFGYTGYNSGCNTCA